MRIDVDKNFVKFNTNNLVNKREFKATPLEFTFTKDYEGLTCKAVFSIIPKTKDEEITFYQQPIIANKCYIPYEVMEGEGVLIGVYGYAVDGEELVLRYSPEPKNLWFLEGSYYEGAEDPEEILPSQFEQYTAYLNSQIARLDQMKIETEDLSNGVKISITNSNGITTETTIYDGEKGEQGERGPEGPQGPAGQNGTNGTNGRDGYVQYTAGNNISISNENVISATDTTYEAGTGIDITNNVISATGGDSYKQVYYLTTAFSNIWSSTPLNSTDIATANKVIDEFRAGKDILIIAKEIAFWQSSNSSIITYNALGRITTGANNKVYFSFYRPYAQGENINNYSVSRTITFNNVGTPASITSASMPAPSQPPLGYDIVRVANTTSYTVSGDYNPAHKKYVDDKPTTYSGYDATKTQVLKNINGTLTWVDEV